MGSVNKNSEQVGLGNSNGRIWEPLSIRKFLTFCLLLLGALTFWAVEDPAQKSGLFNPNQPSLTFGQDSIDPLSGNLNISIPIVNLPSKHLAGIPLSLNYNLKNDLYLSSRITESSTSLNCPGTSSTFFRTITVPRFDGPTGYGWSYYPARLLVYNSTMGDFTSLSDPNWTFQPIDDPANVEVILGDGSTHTFYKVAGTENVWRVPDAGLKLEAVVDKYILHFPDGGKMYFDYPVSLAHAGGGRFGVYVTKFVDVYGSEITYEYDQDCLACLSKITDGTNEINFVNDPDRGLVESITYPSPVGGVNTLSFSYTKRIFRRFIANVYGGTVVNREGWFVESLDLSTPDGESLQYQFFYDEENHGEGIQYWVSPTGKETHYRYSRYEAPTTPGRTVGDAMGRAISLGEMTLGLEGLADLDLTSFGGASTIESLSQDCLAKGEEKCKVDYGGSAAAFCDLLDFCLVVNEDTPPSVIFACDQLSDCIMVVDASSGDNVSAESEERHAGIVEGSGCLNVEDSTNPAFTEELKYSGVSRRYEVIADDLISLTTYERDGDGIGKARDTLDPDGVVGTLFRRNQNLLGNTRYSIIREFTGTNRQIMDLDTETSALVANNPPYRSVLTYYQVGWQSGITGENLGSGFRSIYGKTGDFFQTNTNSPEDVNRLFEPSGLPKIQLTYEGDITGTPYSGLHNWHPDRDASTSGTLLREQRYFYGARNIGLEVTPTPGGSPSFLSVYNSANAAAQANLTRATAAVSIFWDDLDDQGRPYMTLTRKDMARIDDYGNEGLVQATDFFVDVSEDFVFDEYIPHILQTSETDWRPDIPNWILGRSVRQRTSGPQVGDSADVQGSMILYNIFGQLETIISLADPVGVFGVGSLLPDLGVLDVAYTPTRDDLVVSNTYNTTGEGLGRIDTSTVSFGDNSGAISTLFEYTNGMQKNSKIAGLNYFLVEKTINASTGIVSQVLDPNGTKIEVGFDGLGRVKQITPQAPEISSSVEYPTFLKSTLRTGDGIDAGSMESTTIYDTAQRVVAMDSLLEDGTKSRVVTKYDDLGRVFFSSVPFSGGSEEVEPGSVPGTTMAFDSLGRAELSTAADGARVSFAYIGSRVTSQTVDIDGEYATTIQYFDGLGRLAMVDAPEGADAVYRYDPIGNLVRVNLVPDLVTTDRPQPFTAYQAGIFDDYQVRSFTYDEQGRLSKATNPENGTVKYLSYDAVGNATQIEDENARARGYALKYDYDGAGRLVSAGRLETDGSFRLISELTYDQDMSNSDPTNKFNSRLTKLRTRQKAFFGCTDYFLDRSFTYSGLNGRLGTTLSKFMLPIENNFDGSCPTGLEFNDPESNEGLLSQRAILNYHYNSFGQLERLEANPNTMTMSHQFSYAHGFLSEQATTLNGQTKTYIPDIAYNTAGGVHRVSYLNGTVNTTIVDERYRPSQIYAGIAGGVELFDSGSYTFDDAGNILSMGNDVFSYDGISRLTGASVTSRTDLTANQFSYSYDIFGNMTDRSWSNAPGTALRGPGTYFDSVEIAQRRYESAQAGAVVRDNRIHDVSTGSNEIFAYDGNGNVIRDEEHQYVYDEFNRMLATLDLSGNVLAQYVYDNDNERVLKAEFQPGVTNPVSTGVYIRDEAGQVQFEFTRSEENNPEDSTEPIISQAYRAYGYVLGKIAYQLDYSSGLRASNYPQANGLNGDACTTLPGIFQPLFQLTQNGYEVVVPLNVPCQGEDIRALTMVLYEGRHEDSGASTNSQAWEEREKYVVEITLGDDIPDSVVFPNLLYDKDYRAVLNVATTANGFGWVSTDTITGGEARWYVDNENRTPMSLVRHGEVNSFDLTWEDAADFYNVYVAYGTGERTLLTGEPLTQPGVIFDGSVLDGLDLEDGSRFEVDGISGGGAETPLGGITGPTRPGGPGGPGGGGDQLCVFVITPECRNDPSTCRKVCTQLSRSPVEATYFHTDHLGTPRALSDGDGVVISSHDYEPFGLEIPNGLEEDYTHRFTGHERDTKTGLDYMHARYYGNGSARFKSPDPLQEGWNLYVYARNNPIRFVDPFGLFVWDAELGGAATDDELLATDESGALINPEGPSIVDKRKILSKGLADVALGIGGLSGEDAASAQRALDAYGQEYIDNGVTLGLEALGNSEGGRASWANPEDPLWSGNGRVVVVIDSGITDPILIATALAHEGTHTADRRAFAVAALSDIPGGSVQAAVAGALNSVEFTREFKAFVVGANIVRGLSGPRYSLGTNVAWDPKWSGSPPALGVGKRNRAIERHLEEAYDLTREKPGQKLFGQ